MKKKLSIKARITLWYAALILVLCAAALLSLLALADKAQRAHARNTLESATVVLMDELEIEHGQLEIDSDIDEIPNVYAALFDADGSLIYGKRRVQLPFAEGEMRRAQTGERSWYVLDTLLPALAEEFATKLELDWEDGELIYEGEAELNGKRYEFEIRVTGEMLEWERD